jgi:hypothetical protein
MVPMGDLIGKDFETWRKEEHVDPPQNVTEWDEWIMNFFLTIFKIVRHENHVKKWDGKRQLVSIFNSAIDNLNLYTHHSYLGVTIFKEPHLIFFIMDNDEWGIKDIRVNENDFALDLHSIQKEFSKIYRHDAKKHHFGDNDDILKLEDKFNEH